MAPVEHQRFHIDANGREEILSQLILTERGAKKRVRLYPCELTIRCDPKDSSGRVIIKGDMGKITATILCDQDEEEILTIQLKRPITILDNQKLIIISKITGNIVVIRHIKAY